LEAAAAFKMRNCEMMKKNNENDDFNANEQRRRGNPKESFSQHRKRAIFHQFMERFFLSTGFNRI
jgi:hypothetical protein